MCLNGRASPFSTLFFDLLLKNNKTLSFDFTVENEGG